VLFGFATKIGVDEYKVYRVMSDMDSLRTDVANL